MAMLFLTSMPIHEWAHAWAAFQLGDDTAARRGRLTINPLAHLDVVGTISLILVGYGWGKPVPVVPFRLRGNRRASWALVSAAGPFSNFVLAMLAAIPLRLGWVGLSTTASLSLGEILIQFMAINLGLMVFNLIPIPPLDGSRILAWVLPFKWATALERLERYAGPGMMIVLLLLSRVGILSLITSPVFDFLLEALLFS
jgi:Zn-dependent protease